MNENARVINRQAADLAIVQLIVMAVCRQVPDKNLLLADFEEMAEDHTIRTLFSGRPETFFQALEESRRTWRGLLDSLTD